MRNKIIALFLLIGLLFLLSGISIYFQNSKRISPRKTQILENSNAKNLVASKAAETKISKTEIVSEIYDGDTIKTEKGETIRYIGINSPEKTDPFFQKALEKNTSLVQGKTISLQYDVTQKDRYGRTLAYVYVGEKFINLEMIKVGLAVSETLEPNVKHQDEIISAQKFARDNCLGIWNSLCQNNQTCIKITNINYNAAGDDNKNKNGEWVTIQNSCSENISMNSWLLKDSSASNEYRFKNFSLSSTSSVNLYSGCGQDTQNKLYWSCPEPKYAVWNNSGDHAYLYNSMNELVSDFEY